MGIKIPFYLDYLQKEFDIKVKNNPNYSLRSFARWLSIDPSFLSKVFNRKKVLSLEMAENIIVKLAPENKEVRAHFIKSVSAELACFSLQKFDSKLTDCDED